MVAHNFDLRKIGAEQIYGKPTRKYKININFKAFQFVQIIEKLFVFL